VLYQVWAPSKYVALNHRTILVIDSFSAHITDKIKKRLQRLKTHLVVIPAGFTAIFQPLDLGINRSFKVGIRKRWNDWMVHGDHPLTASGNLQKAGYERVAGWVKDTWAELPVEVIVRSFVRAGIKPGAENTKEGAAEDSDGKDMATEEAEEEFDDGVYLLPKNANE
jgi:hypothetical protein